MRISTVFYVVGVVTHGITLDCRKEFPVKISVEAPDRLTAIADVLMSLSDRGYVHPVFRHYKIENITEDILRAKRCICVPCTNEADILVKDVTGRISSGKKIGICAECALSLMDMNNDNESWIKGLYEGERNGTIANCS